ncbi:MAG: hypothetical protein IT458_06300 [Planctomycetes bacterium]|nr:hypothetical protein [Planctomycetota bacterium]
MPHARQDPSPPPSRALLRRIALDVLQRTPSPREVAIALEQPVPLAVRRWLFSEEAMRAWLDEELYYFLLLDNFRPRTEGVESLPRRLAAGTATARDALTEILLSTGFSLRNPGNDTFVTVVLEQVLGLRVQERANKALLEAGKAIYDGRKGRFLDREGRSQSDLVRIAVAQEAATRLLLDRHRQRLFGGGSGPVDAGTVQRVHQEPAAFFTVLGEWLAGPEYAAALARRKTKTDTQFVRALYQDLLDRTPTYDELRNMRNALQSMADAGPLRAVLAKVMLDSGKAQLPELRPGAEDAFVRECFLRYLARAPGQEELPRFVQELGKGARALHVVRALLGSPEYQVY